MSGKTHFTVVRNQGYTAKEFKTRQRHNERLIENYGNGDIDKGRADLNVHFKRISSPDGTLETYEETFKKLLDDGTIVKHGLKPDAKVFAELVFDVNTAYFEENGGYEYAKEFYKAAYDMAVKEVGDERFILSAVLHADEKNAALSEKLGRDVFHYHLHVVYIPVVEKKCYYRKDMKDKSKAGKLKEVINQISHSKKWPIKVPVEKNGKPYFVNSYSLLQDRYFEHMKAAGFGGFERGERGSTAEHLDVLDYKIKQDTIRAGEIKTDIAEMEDALDGLDKEEERKLAKLDRLDDKIKVKETARATMREVDAMGKSALLGGYTVTNDEMKKLKTLAKKSVTADDKIRKARNDFDKERRRMSNKIAAQNGKLRDMQTTITMLTRERDSWRYNYEKLWAEVKEFIGAIRAMPDKLRAFLAATGFSNRLAQRDVSQGRDVSR